MIQSISDTKYHNVQSTQQGNEEAQKNKEQLDRIQEYIQTEFPGIVVWGDSLVQRGVADKLENQVNKKVISPLNDKLEINTSSGIELPVINMGVGSESSAMIAARSGAIPYVVLNDFTVPSDTSKVDISVGLQDGSTPQIKFGRSGSGLESVTINDIEGIIETDYNQHYTFRRLTRGEEEKIIVGTQIYSVGSQLYRHYLPVIYIGTNGGYNDDPNELVLQQQAMVDYIDEPDNEFIIVGIHTGNKEKRSELEAVMRESWGDHYINLREELVKFDYEGSGYELDENDYSKIQAGECPSCILESDGLHFNADGYKLVAQIIFNRMMQLGYFDSLNAIN